MLVAALWALCTGQPLHQPTRHKFNSPGATTPKGEGFVCRGSILQQSCWNRSWPKASAVSKQQSWAFRWWAVLMLALGSFGTCAWRSQYIPQSKTQQFSGQIELMSWVMFVSFNVPVPIRRYAYVQQSEYYKKHSFLPYHISWAWGKYYRNCMLCLL